MDDGLFWCKMGVLNENDRCCPCFSVFPIINLLARDSIERSGGLGPEVWVAVVQVDYPFTTALTPMLLRYDSHDFLHEILSSVASHGASGDPRKRTQGSGIG